MAKKSTSSNLADSSTPSTTQRAYTLRLRGLDPHDHAWRDALWTTHEAVNKGTQVFGDWLLTLRGGISHELADPPPPMKGKRTEDETLALRKNRRILLALSWLSVEDSRGAPTGQLRVATGAETDSERRDKVLSAFQSILASRQVEKQSAESWLRDCADSLSSRIREDAVWINRSAAFDTVTEEIGASLTRDEVWDLLGPFFGSHEAYLTGVELTEDDSAVEEKAKDLVQKAGQWLSSRFGTGTGADFGSMAKVYASMSEWAEGAESFTSGADALKNLAKAMARFNPESEDATGILGLISGPGYKSATRNIVKGWEEQTSGVARADLARFAEVAANDEQKARANVGGKGRRPWSDKILAHVELACGFTYLQQDGPARHSEFAVMLDHAARRVSISHTWIKRAEAERRKFEVDKQRLAVVPSAAAAWLDVYVQERSGSAGGEYRIRRRAIEGWEELLKRWKRASCKTEDDRIKITRELQSDPDIEKFGDIQLFEALAAQGDVESVWRSGDTSDPDILRNYVLGHDARDKQRRFKVPAYRHPDALRHPVFCDFGNSRWEIEYSVHRASRSSGTKRKPSESDAVWLRNPHGLRMGLWDGHLLRETDMRWSSKRLVKDLAIRQGGANTATQEVARADRLGRAAAGVAADARVSPAGLLALEDWNGRLQAPRYQLDQIARHVEKYGWDSKAKLLRGRIDWLVSFSAKLECRGPYVEFAKQFGDEAPAKPFVSRKGELAVKHDTNEKRTAHAKLILSRLPGLRVLSVDLGHRFAAACAVWHSLSRTDFLHEIAGRAIMTGGTATNDLFCHTQHVDANSGKKRTTIYRRIGEDFLRDPKTSKPTTTPHPAPWARLDRQFLIKLQGEEHPARAAAKDKNHDGSPTEVNEVALVDHLAAFVGLKPRADDEARGRTVDELMSRAVRIVTLGLKRHGRMAKIAYAFNPECPGIPGMGGSLDTEPVKQRNDKYAEFILKELVNWHSLATDTEYDGSEPRRLWNTHIGGIAPDFKIPDSSPTEPEAERPTRQKRRKDEDDLKERLKPIAGALTRDAAACRRICGDWTRLWKASDGSHARVPQVAPGTTGPRKTEPTAPATGWYAQLRAITDWVMGSHLEGATKRTWNQCVGGLSLDRIATMRSLYQLHKAFAMRARPDKIQGAPDRGDSNEGVAQGILNTMERLREQRVKQIASRIVEAALGVGRHKPAKGKDREHKRPQSQVDDPCHAIVIENLRNYRPDELQTRRENKALMTWSAGKVRKYLEEGCQLHGLHLREVMPNYTSQQCSRTGLPGMRCVDVHIDKDTGIPRAYWWPKAVEIAKTKGDAPSRLTVALSDRLAELKARNQPLPASIRVPRRGGDLFVAARPMNDQTDDAARGALQADLNAAANIGLRALMDPDFPGKWWYIPCTEDKVAGRAFPRADKVKGSACFAPDPSKPEQFGSLTPPKDPDQQESEARKGKRTTEAEGKEITNFWCDASAHTLRNADTKGYWLATPAYWGWVRKRVSAVLWLYNKLDIAGSPCLAPDEQV